MKDEEPTITDVLGAVTAFADATEKTLEGIKSDIVGIKSDITSIKAVMVTKDYLDRKIADSRADVVGKIQKIDGKDTALVHALQKKKVISAAERNEIVAMSPFSRLAA